nr:excitatory amino acid transporter 1-like [Onthophagus taurus]
MKIFQKKKSFLKDNLLTILTVVGVFGGVILGISLRSSTDPWSKRHIMYLEFPGKIFLRMLKMLIVPLLVSSVVSAVGSLDLSLSKKIAFRSIGYYAVTTVLAVTLGIILVVTIRPGAGLSEKFGNETSQVQSVRNVLTQDTLMDLIRNLFPPNLIQATFAQYQTVLVAPPKDNSDPEKEIPLTDYTITNRYENTTNVLGLVVFAIILGVALGMMKEKGKTLLNFFQSTSEAMMVITRWVIWFSPVGVFFLVAAQVLETKSFAGLVEKLGLYFMTVLIGLLVHCFITLSILYFLVTRKLPFKVLGGLSQVLVTAFGTASSSATMPLTIQTLDDMGIDPRVTRFVIPVGSTINMDGTALYEAVAAIFIAQFRKVPYSFGQLIAVSITATFASIGAAGIPQAGLVTMVMVLDTVGLPSSDISYILAVDWLLDRFRTTINVIGDSLGSCIVDSLSKNELSKMDDIDRLNADPHELVEIAKADSHV